MTDKYILKGHEAVRCDDLMTWANWLEKADRHVRKHEADGVRVSTVFMGLDHSFGDGPPLLFETMIFGGPHDGFQDRFATWEEAEEGHDAAVAMLTAGTASNYDSADE